MAWVGSSLGKRGAAGTRAQATLARRHPWNVDAQHPPPREFPRGVTEKERVLNPCRPALSFLSGGIGDAGVH